MSHQVQAPPPAARNYSLQRLARYRLAHHLNSYKKQKRAKVDDAPKIFDESDSLLSFPSTSNTSTPNKCVNVPLEKVFEDAQHSLRIQLNQRELKQIPSSLVARFNLDDTLFLDLSANSLTELPEFVSRLTRLQTLVARQNRLGSRLEMQLHGLVYLDLSGNRLTSLADNFLNSAQQLRILLLAGNRLEKLNLSISNLASSLEELDLSSNLIVELPSQLGLLKNLRVLNVSNNRISELPREIGNLEQLSVFDVSLNRLERLPSSMWRLAVNTRAQITFRIEENPFIEPPLHIVRRGRRHVGKFLRNLAIKEHISAGNNIDNSMFEDIYDVELYESHGISKGRTTEPRQNRMSRMTSIFTTNDSPSSVRRYAEGGDCCIAPWNIPLSVNTINTTSTFASSVDGAAVIGGTDSGYASTVDEHRFSHEFACLSTGISVDQAEKHANDLKSGSKVSENVSSPIVPPLDLKFVEQLEIPINQACATNHIMKTEMIKMIDSNNNSNCYKNNNNLENIKKVDVTINGGFVGNRVRYNGLHVNNMDKLSNTGSSPSLANANGAGGNRLILQKNGNLLVNLHSSLNNSTAKALSPLVERNENSWNSATGELPPQPPLSPNNVPAVANNDAPANERSNDERQKPLAINSDSSSSNLAKISSTVQKYNKDKIATNKRTKGSIIAPSSSTLPRKMTNITKTASSTMSSTSNSSDPTRIIKTSVMGSKLLSGSTTRLARSVKDLNSTVTSVKPACRVVSGTTSTTTRLAVKNPAPMKPAKSTTEITVPSLPSNRVTSKVVTETKTSSSAMAGNKMSKSTIAPTTKATKRAPIVTGERTERGLSTVRKVELSTQSQTFNSKSSSTMHIARKVAPTSVTYSANTRTSNISAKRH